MARSHGKPELEGCLGSVVMSVSALSLQQHLIQSTQGKHLESACWNQYPVLASNNTFDYGH